MQHPILISADYDSLCTPERLDLMTGLVVAELFLLTLVLSKLAYDVWHYQRTGEMPWLARNICLGYSYAGIQTRDQDQVKQNEQ